MFPPFSSSLPKKSFSLPANSFTLVKSYNTVMGPTNHNNSSSSFFQSINTTLSSSNPLHLHPPANQIQCPLLPGTNPNPSYIHPPFLHTTFLSFSLSTYNYSYY
ncbi:hypothetical protein QVD17_34901 [Tagetes erecta]|uniref:Uncharacterized protein n=1 Tax=Tagetes erecta TaxID=13708 RepID=A0AAD8NKP4_TARER|nr:hypothetical protein QVD17_34901 [Tagetes erecta]